MEKTKFCLKRESILYLLDNHTSVREGIVHGLFVKNLENLWWLSAVGFD